MAVFQKSFFFSLSPWSHFEITCDPCNLIGSLEKYSRRDHWCDFFYKSLLNQIFFPASKTALLKHNNQSDFKGFFFEESNEIAVKLYIYKDKLCNFLQISSILDQQNIAQTTKTCIWTTEFFLFQIDVLKW